MYLFTTTGLTFIGLVLYLNRAVWRKTYCSIIFEYPGVDFEARQFEFGMELFETPTVRLSLYDKETTIVEIAQERTRSKTEPNRTDLEDPFIIYDLGDAVCKDKQWKESLPQVQIFFAVKSNPDPVFLRLMIGLGKGFDCASRESHLRFAREKGVRLMTFDTEEELHKVKRVYPEARLVLRVVFDDATCGLEMGVKFGCRNSEVRPLMELAKDLGLGIYGVCFHIGSQAGNPRVFREAIRYTRPIIDEGRRLGLDMKLLDIGGGFPGRLYPEEPFGKFAEAVREALEENFPPSSGVSVIAEPGTFYTRSAGYLVANVMAKRIYKPRGNKDTYHNANGSTDKAIWMYYLNVGVFNAFNGPLAQLVSTFFEVPEPLHPKDSGEKQQLKPSCLWGPTCHPHDVIFEKCMMPEMESGDFVMFHDMGGYITSCASGFNGYEVPPTSYIAPKESRPLLERIFSA
ncbi:ornithine decarboxylase-like isoform X2 [Patiria miniata]|uniref:ornithine decarboxylase n=1 Tax=Patiria miniata TaxID=46514 RepID=A0A914APT9_PATMI|nr:ornithine decarboxylase-like isoform X2 [Patiria miniata]